MSLPTAATASQFSQMSDSQFETSIPEDEHKIPGDHDSRERIGRNTEWSPNPEVFDAPIEGPFKRPDSSGDPGVGFTYSVAVKPSSDYVGFRGRPTTAVNDQTSEEALLEIATDPIIQTTVFTFTGKPTISPTSSTHQPQTETLTAAKPCSNKSGSLYASQTSAQFPALPVKNSQLLTPIDTGDQLVTTRQFASCENAVAMTAHIASSQGREMDLLHQAEDHFHRIEGSGGINPEMETMDVDHETPNNANGKQSAFVSGQEDLAISAIPHGLHKASATEVLTTSSSARHVICKANSPPIQILARITSPRANHIVQPCPEKSQHHATEFCNNELTHLSNTDLATPVCIPRSTNTPQEVAYNSRLHTEGLQRISKSSVPKGNHIQPRDKSTSNVRMEGQGESRNQKSKSISQISQHHSADDQGKPDFDIDQIAGIFLRAAKRTKEEMAQSKYEAAQNAKEATEILEQHKLQIQGLRNYIQSLEDEIHNSEMVKNEALHERDTAKSRLVHQLQKFKQLQRCVAGFDSDLQRLRKDQNEMSRKLKDLRVEKTDLEKAVQDERKATEEKITASIAVLENDKVVLQNRIKELEVALNATSEVEQSLNQQLNQKVGELSDERDRCLRLDTRLEKIQQVQHDGLMAFLVKFGEETSQRLASLQEDLTTTNRNAENNNRMQECLTALHKLQEGQSSKDVIDSIGSMLASMEERITVRDNQIDRSSADISPSANAMESRLCEQLMGLKSDLTSHEALWERISTLESSRATLEERNCAQQEHRLKNDQDRESQKLLEASLKDRVLQLETEVRLTNHMRNSTVDEIHENNITQIQIAMLRNKLTESLDELHKREEVQQTHVSIVDALKKENEELRDKVTEVESKIVHCNASKEEFDRQVLEGVKEQKEANRKSVLQQVAQMRVECDNKIHQANQATAEVRKQLTSEISSIKESKVALLSDVNTLQQQLRKQERDSPKQHAKELKGLETALHAAFEKKIVKERQDSEAALQKAQQEREQAIEDCKAEMQKQQIALAKIQSRVQDQEVAQALLQTQYEKAQYDLVTTQRSAYDGTLREAQLLQKYNQATHDTKEILSKLFAERDSLQQRLNAILKDQKIKLPAASETSTQDIDGGKTDSLTSSKSDPDRTETLALTAAPKTGSLDTSKPKRVIANRHKNFNSSTHQSQGSKDVTYMAIEETQSQVNGIYDSTDNSQHSTQLQSQFQFPSQSHSQSTASALLEFPSQSQSQDSASVFLEIIDQDNFPAVGGKTDRVVVQESQDPFKLSAASTKILDPGTDMLVGGQDSLTASALSSVAPGDLSLSNQYTSTKAITYTAKQTIGSVDAETVSGHRFDALTNGFNDLHQAHNNRIKASAVGPNISSARKPSTLAASDRVGFAVPNHKTNVKAASSQKSTQNLTYTPGGDPLQTDDSDSDSLLATPASRILTTPQHAPHPVKGSQRLGERISQGASQPIASFQSSMSQQSHPSPLKRANPSSYTLAQPPSKRQKQKHASKIASKQRPESRNSEGSSSAYVPPGAKRQSRASSKGSVSSKAVVRKRATKKSSQMNETFRSELDRAR